MEIENAVGLIGLIAAVAISVYYISDYQTSLAGLTSAPVQQTLNLGGAAIPDNSSSAVSNLVLTSNEVAKHSIQSDCWIVIDEKVYVVSNFIRIHPGGASRIIPYCGRDATQAFATKGDKGEPHSSRAHDILASFYLGDIGRSVSAENVTQSQQQSANIPAGIGEDESEEEEDD